MATTTKYFYHSPRGFSNEVEVYAVPSEIVDEWRETLEARLGSSALYAATAVTPITRKQADALLRRDGVVFQTHHDDAQWLLAERQQHTINPESVRSARRNATEMIADIKREMAFEANMDAAYPEYAVALR